MAAENSLPTVNRRDIDFQLFEHLEIGSLTARPYFADHDRATMTAALDTAQAIAAQHFQTHNRKADRSEEHTSELQSLMRISYAVFCWTKKTTNKTTKHTST